MSKKTSVRASQFSQLPSSLSSDATHKRAREEAYRTVTVLRSFEDRCKDGTQSNICLDKDGWLFKSDLTGGDAFVAHELTIYNRLRDLHIAPEADHNFFVHGPDTIRIKQINHGGTFLEYSTAYTSGLIGEEIWRELCAEVRRVLGIFFEAGFVHGDLHARNIVIELTSSGDWRAFVIDFAVSFNVYTQSDDLARLGRLGIFFEIIPSQEDDIEYLIKDLVGLPLDELEDIRGDVVELDSCEPLEGDVDEVVSQLTDWQDDEWD